eukprot:scaffold223459_cov18-Prasinocladus_malaysianus.AAC.3
MPGHFNKLSCDNQHLKLQTRLSCSAVGAEIGHQISKRYTKHCINHANRQIVAIPLLGVCMPACGLRRCRAGQCQACQALIIHNLAQLFPSPGDEDVGPFIGYGKLCFILAIMPVKTILKMITGQANVAY